MVKESQKTDKSDQNGYEPAKKILKERTVNKSKQYLVLFTDGSQYWCSDVKHHCYKSIESDKRDRGIREESLPLDNDHYSGISFRYLKLS